MRRHFCVLLLSADRKTRLACVCRFFRRAPKEALHAQKCMLPHCKNARRRGGNPPINRILTSLHRPDNTIKVQCVFAFKLRVRFAARSLEYAWYAFTRALRGRQRAWKQKSPTVEKGNFLVLQGGRTQKYQAYFKKDNAVKPNNSPLGGSL